MNVKDFHVKNKYYISINSLPNFYGCIAKFPENILNSIDKITKIYILNEDFTIEYYLIIKNKKKLTKIKAHNNNIRLLVIQDIMLTAFLLKISKELIIVQDKDKNLFELLKIPQTRQQMKSELDLCLSFRKLLTGSVPDSNIDGFDQLFHYFEKGGFTP